MPTAKMTDRKLEQLKPEPGKRRTIYSDEGCRGLKIRVSAGKKVWMMHYRRKSDGKQNTVDLGDFPIVGLEQARKVFYTTKERIDKGVDPASEKKRRYVIAKDGPKTFAGLAAQYLEQHSKPTKRTWGEDQRMINAYLNPDIGNKAAADVTSEDIEVILGKILDRGKKSQRDHVLIFIRGIYNWGIERDAQIREGGLRYNPTIGIKKVVSRKDNVRKRNLSEDEIRTFWQKLDDTRLRDDVKDILRLVLLTVCRTTEITAAHAKEFRRDRTKVDGEMTNILIWTIPAERVKNKRDHPLPLPSTRSKHLQAVS